LNGYEQVKQEENGVGTLDGRKPHFVFKHSSYNTQIQVKTPKHICILSIQQIKIQRIKKCCANTKTIMFMASLQDVICTSCRSLQRCYAS